MNIYSTLLAKRQSPRKILPMKHINHQITSRILLATICALAAISASSRAMSTEIDQHLIQFAANNTEFHDLVEKTARQIYLRNGYGCPTITQIARQLPKNLGPLTFPAPEPRDIGQSPHFPPPETGLWTEQVKLVACNKAYTINMLAVGRALNDSKTPLLLATLPGSTNIDPSLQGQATRTGANAIARNDPDGDCTQPPTVKDTKFIGYMGQDHKSLSTVNTNNGWFEEWDYQFCQTPITVQLVYLMSDKGGNNITARVKTNTPEPQPKP